jgi:tetratricopeptide (TPR) repeat protein
MTPKRYPFFYRIITVVLLSILSCSCSKKDSQKQFLDAAKKLFDSGEFEKSKAEYLKVLNANPKNKEALAQIGRIWMEQGNPMKAYPYLLQMRTEEPKDLELRTKLLSILVSQRASKEVRLEAWKEAQAILDLDPGNEKALTLLVTLAESSLENKEAREKEEAELIKVAEQRVAAAPDQDSVAVHLAGAYLLMKKGIKALHSNQTGAEDAARLNFDAAGRGIEKALEKDPNSVTAHMYLAVLYSLQKDGAGEERELKTVAEKAPLRSPEKLSFGELKLRRSRFLAQLGAGHADSAKALLAEARAVAQESTEKAPDYLPGWMLLANVELATGNAAAVQACARKVLDIDPSHSDGRLLLGEALLKEGQAGQAAEVLLGLVKELPGYAKPQFLLASAYVRNDEMDKALPLLGALTARTPDFPEAKDAVYLMASVKIAKGREQEAIPELQAFLKDLSTKGTELNRRLEEAQKQDDSSEAGTARLQVLRAELGRITGDILKGSLLLSAAFQKAKQLDDASATVAGLLKLASAGTALDTKLRLQLGVLQRQAGKPVDARATFETILKNSPDDLASISQLVEIDLQSGSFDSAQQRLQPLLGKSPVPVEALFLQGVVLSGQQKWDEAEAALLKALETKPDYEPATRKLVDTYMKANKSDLALQRLKERLAAHPDDIQSLSAAGLICEGKKDFAQAIQYYEKLLSLKPELPLILNNLANIHLTHHNDPEKAYKLALQARNLRPASALPVTAELPEKEGNPQLSANSLTALEPAVIADTLGWIQFKRREYAEALALIREADKSLSFNGEVKYHLGLALAMMGEVDAARTALEAALKPASGLPEDFPGRAESKSMLELLSGDGKASGELEVLSSKEPANPFLSFMLGKACEKEGDTAKAEAAYRSAIKSSPKMLPAWISLAKLLARDPSKQTQALELVKQARGLAPSNEQLGELGSIARRAGDYEWAQPLLSQSVATSGGTASPEVLEDLAWATYYSSRIVEARKHMQAALEKVTGQNVTPAPELAARASSFLKLTGLSEQEAEDAQQSDPESVPAKVYQAGKLHREGKTAEAEAICKSLLERYPRFAPAQATLAGIYLANVETRSRANELANEARRVLEQDDLTLSLQPGLLTTLGALSYFEKDYRRAIQLLERIPAEQLGPVAKFYLGLSLHRNGDKAAGIAHLNSAIQSGLPEPMKAEASGVIGGE